MKGRILMIDYLKVIAIFLVLTCHLLYINYIGTSLEPVAWLSGAIGVGLFLFSAGYLAQRTFKTPFKMGSYFKDKLVRLYPLFILAFVFALLLTPGQFKMQYLALYPFMLQMFVPNALSYLWFVSAIFFAYVLYALYNVDAKYGWAAGALMAVALIMVGQLYIVVQIGMFFVGVYLADRVALEQIELVDSKAVKTISNSTYCIYIFHIPIWYMMMNIVTGIDAFVLLFVPLVIGVGILLQSQYDVSVKRVKSYIY